MSKYSRLTLLKPTRAGVLNDNLRYRVSEEHYEVELIQRDHMVNCGMIY